MDITNPKKTDEKTKSEETPRYKIRDAEYALQPHEPLDYVVEKLIISSSVNVIYGKPGSKKTYAMLSLGVCVAEGRQWLGYDVNQCTVLFIDEESGERRLTLRMAAAIRGEFGNENTPIRFVSLARFKLDNKEDIDEIESLIENTGAGLVIIDALANVMDGDENAKMDCQPVFTALRIIAERTNTAIIVIHHPNKSGGYRGSTAIEGALDLLIKITSEDDSCFINFKTEKTRDLDSLKFSGEAHWADNQFYLTEAEPEDRTKQLSPSKKYVIRFLKEHGESRLPDITGAADVCSPDSARRAIYQLAEAGLAYRTNKNEHGQGVVATYDLTLEGRDYELG